MIMDNDKGDVRSNEVIGRREADGLSECGAGTVNSAPIGPRCNHIPGRIHDIYFNVRKCKICDEWYEIDCIGREPPHGASGGPID